MKIKKIIVFMMFLAVLSSCSCEASFTTANYSDLEMAKVENEEIIYTDRFETDTEVIYLVGIIKNNPGEIEIKGEWYYLEDEDVFIDSAKMKIDNMTSDFSFSLGMPEAGWPAGKYEIRVYINDKLKETIEFIVE